MNYITFTTSKDKSSKLKNENRKSQPCETPWLPRKRSERFPWRLDPLISQRGKGWERGKHPKTQIWWENPSLESFFLSERKKDKESQSVHIITERFQSSTWATQTTYFADGEALQLTPAIKFLLTIDERQLPQSCFDLDLKPILLFFVQ